MKKRIVSMILALTMVTTVATSCTKDVPPVEEGTVSENTEEKAEIKPIFPDFVQSVRYSTRI